MGWKYEEDDVSDKPNKPSIFYYLLALIFAFVCGLILHYLHIKKELWVNISNDFIIIYYLPVSLVMLLFVFHCYLFGRNLQAWNIRVIEQARVLEEWRRWAARNVVLLDGFVLLPDKMTASYLYEHPDVVEAQWGLAKKITYLSLSVSKIKDLFNSLLYAIKDSINKLPQDYDMKITLFNDYPASQWLVLENAFSEAWQILFPERRLLKRVNVSDNFSIEHMDEWFRQGGNDYQLSVVLQLNGKDNYSDSIATMIFAVDDLYADKQPAFKAKILRVMPLDENEIESDFSVFFRLQSDACQAKYLVGDNKNIMRYLPAIYKTAKERNINLKPENIKINEMFSGLQGPFAEAILIAFSSDLSRKINAPCLVISNSGGWVGTVIPGKSSFSNQ